MVHPYLRRREGTEVVTYPSPELEKVLHRTLAVPLFQEQVMQIAMVAAGFSADEADKVRRSMAAWERRGGLEAYRDKLLSGMQARGYPPEFAQAIYQQILGFGSYGFPLSHSASFALLAYVSAWLRRHAPAAFFAGLLNSWPMGFYAPAQLINDARRQGLCFRPVDIQVSDWDCTLERAESGEAEVRLGLRMVGGLSETSGQALIESRRLSGTFRDVEDLAHRANLSRRELWVLAGSGALAPLARHRRLAAWGALGAEHLPGMMAEASAREGPVSLQPPSPAQEIILDYRTLGLTLGHHPLALLRAKLDRLRVVKGVELRRLQTQREPVLGARLMIIEGTLQSALGVIHVIAKTVRDYSHWLGPLRSSSRDFR